MDNQINTGKIKIDGMEYEVSDLSDAAKIQLVNLQFVEEQIQYLKNQLAVADTARLGYNAAIKKELVAPDAAD